MRTAVYSVAGDRRDGDIIRQGELLGGAFDRVILYEDHYLRGRQQGEIIGLLRAGLAKGWRTKEMQAFTEWDAAADTALRLIRPGELLLVQADVVDLAVDYLKKFLATEATNGAAAATAVNAAESLKAAVSMHVAG
jgi:cyanophycin synthetase